MTADTDRDSNNRCWKQHIDPLLILETGNINAIAGYKEINRINIRYYCGLLAEGLYYFFTLGHNFHDISGVSRYFGIQAKWVNAGCWMFKSILKNWPPLSYR